MVVKLSVDNIWPSGRPTLWPIFGTMVYISGTTVIHRYERRKRKSDVQYVRMNVYIQISYLSFKFMLSHI